MRKKLVRHGNSFALILDKALREVLELGPSRIVEIRTDGRRLIIDPVVECVRHPPMPPLPPIEGELTIEMQEAALADLKRLQEEHAMSRQHFEQLQTGCSHWFRYYSWLSGPWPVSADAGQMATVRRLRACMELLDAGTEWELAIAEALHAAPVVVVAAPPDQVATRCPEVTG